MKKAYASPLVIPHPFLKGTVNPENESGVSSPDNADNDVKLFNEP